MRSDWLAIVADADELELIRDCFFGLRKRTDASRARDLITLRRRLADRLIATSHHVKALAANDAAAANLADAGRRLLSGAQSRVALHQADWPAVKLNYDDAGYTASAQAADAAIQALITWIRQHSASS